MDPDALNIEIDRVLNQELSDDSELEESDDELGMDVVENEDSESEFVSLFGDDTDEDLSYFPENENCAGTSGLSCKKGRPSIRNRLHGITRDEAQQRRPMNRSESSDEDMLDDVDDEPMYKWQKVQEGRGDDNFSHQFTFVENPGPKHCPPATAKPIDYFNLFFSQSLLNMFVTETNRYVEQSLAVKKPNLTCRRRLYSLVPTTIQEIRAFIIVIINMGLVRKPTIKSYWSGSYSQSTPWFAKMFSRDRFESLLSSLHMVDNKKLPKPNMPGYDPCQKFQPLLDHCKKVFTYYYQAHEQLFIDESLIGTQLMQYIPNKHHHRRGVKLWVLYDSVTNYCLSFFCDKGKYSTEDIKNGLAYVVVKKLLSFCKYLHKGFHVFTDNLYTSVPLLDYLYNNQTFMTGTVRKNRKHLPKEVKSKLNVGQKVYYKMENKPYVALAYRQKKSQKHPVILLSSKPKVHDVEVSRTRHGKVSTETKPSIVRDYCKYMGGIDTFDMMLYSYLDERRCMKYWRKVTFNLFARMVLNCYVLYSENCKNNGIQPTNRYAFIVSIINSVTEEWLGEQLANGVQPANRQIGLFALPGNQTKTCWVCTPKGKNYQVYRKRSRLACSNCYEGCHGTCVAAHVCKQS